MFSTDKDKVFNSDFEKDFHVTFEVEGQTYTAKYEAIPDWSFDSEGRIEGYNCQFMVRDFFGNKINQSGVWGKGNLRNVQAGDKVVYTKYNRDKPNECSVKVVEKATKTQLTVDGIRYMRSTGYKYGTGDRWGHSIAIEQYTPERVAIKMAYRLEEEAKVGNKRLLQDTRKKVLDAVSTADLETLNKILEHLAVIEISKKY